MNHLSKDVKEAQTQINQIIVINVALIGIFVKVLRIKQTQNKHWNTYPTHKTHNFSNSKGKKKSIIGTKTTHWILNKYLYGLDFFQKKLKGDFDVKRYVISVDTPNKNSNLKNITYVLGQESENYKKYFSLFKTVMGKGALPAYKPETGILTILYFLDRFETIYLHNFDFGKTPHYYSKKSDSGKVTKIADLPNQKHAWNYSKKIVEYFIEKNRIKIVNEKNKIGVTDGE